MGFLNTKKANQLDTILYRNHFNTLFYSKIDFCAKCRFLHDEWNECRDRLLA